MQRVKQDGWGRRRHKRSCNFCRLLGRDAHKSFRKNSDSPIRAQWLDDTLAYPARIESDQEDSELLHALRPIAEHGFRVLRVIYNETVNPVAIVTAYFDDEVKDL